MQAWQARLARAPVADTPAPPTGVFRTDAELKTLLKKHLGVRSCPTAVERPALIESAVRLGLLHASDSTVAAPGLASRGKSWTQHVQDAVPRTHPLSPDPARYWTDEELQNALETHLPGQTAPERIGRSKLLEQAVTLNLVTAEQAGLPPPVRLTEGRLRELWDEHAVAEVRHGMKRPALPKGGRKGLTAALLSLGLIDAVTAQAKRARPDVAARQRTTRDARHATRCASAKELLKGLVQAEAVRLRMSQVSEEASRLFHQRSFLLWLHLHRLVRAEQPLPDMYKDALDTFVRRVYTIGTANSTVGTLDPELKATLDQNKELFPPLSRPAYCNLVTHAANTYAGALRRHFCDLDTVKQRVRRYVAARLLDFVVRPAKGEEDVAVDPVADGRQRREDPGQAPVYNVLNALSDPKLDISVLHARQQAMVTEVRTLLSLPADVELNARWLRRNIHASIRFTLTVVDTLDELRAEVEAVRRRYEATIADEAKRPKIHAAASRGIHFVPLNHAKRRFVTLDATDLVQVLRLGEVEPSLQAEMVQAALQPNITRVFGKSHTPRTAAEPEDGKPRWLFTGTVDTDGHSLHPHFIRAQTPEEAAAKQAAKAAATGARGREAEAEAEAPPKRAAPPRLLLLVDPGRVNLVTLTVMLNGQPVRVPGCRKGRVLTFTLTNRQYYTLIGDRKRQCVLKQRQRGAEQRSDGSKELRAALSATSLRSGRAEDVTAYMQAHLGAPKASSAEWSRALSSRSATDRWRRQVARDRAMLRWFHQVWRRIKVVVGEKEATVVWGCRVAPTGRGNLPVPTDRVAQLAKRVVGWEVVSGDEYRTSAACCVAPHPDNLAPRLRGERTVRNVRRPEGVRAQTRKGFVLGLDAKRMLRRAEHEGKTLRCTGSAPDKGKRARQVVKWTLDGHSGEEAEVKAAKKATRETNGWLVKYARGLRVYKDGDILKFVGRDPNGSINIGIIWLSDNVAGRTRPSAFVRPTKARPMGVVPPETTIAPCSKQQVRGEKAHTAINEEGGSR